MERICICPNGWIFVGLVGEEMPNGGFLLSRCATIRVWGTSKGIGELVNGPIKVKDNAHPNGPTILDYIDTPVHVHPIATFEVKGFF